MSLRNHIDQINQIDQKEDTVTMHEAVFNQLPTSGDSITVYDITKKVDGLSAREVRTSLLELQKEGRAGLDYGFGWFRVTNPVPAATGSAVSSTEVQAEFTSFHGESQTSAKAASEAIDEYYNSVEQSLALNEAISEDDGYAALRWITAKAIANAGQLGPSPEKIGQLVREYDDTRKAISALTARELHGPQYEPLADAIYDFAYEIAGLLRPVVPAVPETVASLDGTVDEADWIAEGHVLDAQEVAYIRSLIIPATTPVSASEG